MNDTMIPQEGPEWPLGLRQRRRRLVENDGSGGGAASNNNNENNTPSAGPPPPRFVPPTDAVNMTNRFPNLAVDNNGLRNRTPVVEQQGTEDRRNIRGGGVSALLKIYCFLSLLMANAAIFTTSEESPILHKERPISTSSTLSDILSSKYFHLSWSGSSPSSSDEETPASEEPETPSKSSSLYQSLTSYLAFESITKSKSKEIDTKMDSVSAWIKRKKQNSAKDHPLIQFFLLDDDDDHHPLADVWATSYGSDNNMSTIIYTLKLDVTSRPSEIYQKIVNSPFRIMLCLHGLLAVLYTWLVHVAHCIHPQEDQTTTTSNHNNPHRPGQNNTNQLLVFQFLLTSAVWMPKETHQVFVLLEWFLLMSGIRKVQASCQYRLDRPDTVVPSSHSSSDNSKEHIMHVLSGLLVLTSLEALVVYLASTATEGNETMNQQESSSAPFLNFHHGLLLLMDNWLLSLDLMVLLLKWKRYLVAEEYSVQAETLEQRQSRLVRSMSRSNNGDGVPDSDGAEQPPTEEVEDAAVMEELLNQASGTSQVGDSTSTMDANDILNEEESIEVVDTVSLQAQSRQLDHEMEELELANAQASNTLDNILFGLQVLQHILIVGHLAHVWSLHGVQFTLMDGVLALQVHNALTMLVQTIARKRNSSKFTQKLDTLIPDATLEELFKANEAGDVCCICLGTMSAPAASTRDISARNGTHLNSVKKIECGHLYHFHCLKQVVERAPSIHSAKCPLCRACVIPSGDATPPAVPDPTQREAPATNNAEHALFRISTEHIFPAWIPVPAFSFEVVRRPPAGESQPTAQRVPQAENVQDGAAALGRVEQELAPAENAPPPQGTANANAVRPQAARDDENIPSLLRRIFEIATGAMTPMTPEEEAQALIQLTDMFPQYTRQELLTSLRERGSMQAVVEAVLQFGTL